MNLKRFRSSKVPMTKKVVDAVYGVDLVHSDKVYCYCNSYFIEVYSYDDFYFVYGTSEYKFNALDQAEEKLFSLL